MLLACTLLHRSPTPGHRTNTALPHLQSLLQYCLKVLLRSELDVCVCSWLRETCSGEGWVHLWSVGIQTVAGLPVR